MQDPLTAPLSDPDMALVRYAKKLTHCPNAMEDEDLNVLRAHGFDDRAIHDATQVVALFAYYNRVAEGLGVTWDGESERESPPEPGPEPRGEIG